MRKVASPLYEGVVVGDGYSKSYIDSYHRTGDIYSPLDDTIATIKDIVTRGFIPGEGDMYGKGLYSTGDWPSQFGGRGNSDMGEYGPAIIKYRTPAKGVLIFDYRVVRWGNILCTYINVNPFLPSKDDLVWVLPN